jgi:hypothetical protein
VHLVLYRFELLRYYRDNFVSTMEIDSLDGLLSVAPQSRLIDDQVYAFLVNEQVFGPSWLCYRGMFETACCNGF